MGILTWETIYKYWQVHSDWDFEKNLARPLIFKKEYLSVEDELSTSFDYSWCAPEKLSEHVAAVSEQLRGGYAHDEHRYKGVSYHLELLATAENDEERAALWIYGHAHDFLQKDISASTFEYLSEIHDATRSFLKERYILKTERIPTFIHKHFIASHILKNTEFSNFEPLIHLTMANTEMIRKNYIPVFVCTNTGCIPSRYRISE